MGLRASAWRGRRVLITGHTGFKGAWLSLWLTELGAQVTGFSLPPPTRPSLFELGHVRERLDHVEGDVRDRSALSKAFRRSEPEVVLHLAAQSLVRESYRRRVDTYETNVLGTANVLEAVRETRSTRATVIVTSDKCYENPGAARAFREEDPLGGHDPYSSSKACAELVSSAYRACFFRSGTSAIVATARAAT